MQESPNSSKPNIFLAQNPSLGDGQEKKKGGKSGRKGPSKLLLWEDSFSHQQTGAAQNQKIWDSEVNVTLLGMFLL